MWWKQALLTHLHQVLLHQVSDISHDHVYNDLLQELWDPGDFREEDSWILLIQEFPAFLRCGYLLLLLKLLLFKITDQSLYEIGLFKELMYGLSIVNNLEIDRSQVLYDPGYHIFDILENGEHRLLIGVLVTVRHLQSYLILVVVGKLCGYLILVVQKVG